MRARAWFEAVNILVINPNSTASMTASICDAARSAASSGTNITARNPEVGPPSIQGAEDGEAALPGLFSLYEDEMERGQYHAVIIACFDDTGLWHLRQRSPIPVTGIGEAGYLVAARYGRFSVVTTLDVSVPVLEANIAAYEFSDQCVNVRASGIPVLALEDEQASEEPLKAEIEAAIREDQCDAIVLGCAGMAAFTKKMQDRFGLPIVDGVAAAVMWCEDQIQ